jgi:hypothetical protein
MRDMEIQPESRMNGCQKLWPKELRFSIMMKVEDETDLKGKRLLSP